MFLPLQIHLWNDLFARPRQLGKITWHPVSMADVPY